MQQIFSTLMENKLLLHFSGPQGLYVVYIWKYSSAYVLGASVVWHLSLPQINSLNKTEAAVFQCSLCFLKAFSFISLILNCFVSYKLNMCIPDFRMEMLQNLSSAIYGLCILIAVCSKGITKTFLQPTLPPIFWRPFP